MNDALLVIDVVSRFAHEDGERLLASFRERLQELRATMAITRGRGVPVIHVNDRHGRWDGDVQRLLREAWDGPGGDVVAALAPEAGEPFILKSRYSAFDHTPLPLLLEELAVERVLLVGGTTEACIVQSAIDARERGLKVTVVAPACATIDPALEQIALTYAERVAGVRIVSSIDELIAGNGGASSA